MAILGMHAHILRSLRFRPTDVVAHSTSSGVVIVAHQLPFGLQLSEPLMLCTGTRRDVFESVDVRDMLRLVSDSSRPGFGVRLWLEFATMRIGCRLLRGFEKVSRWQFACRV